MKRLDPDTGQVKRLWVADSACGMGLARRMMAAIESTALDMGLRSLKLETNRVLGEAVALYRATGWTEIGPFTGLPADTWLGKVL